MEQTKSHVGSIVLTIIITTAVVGGGIYYFQKSKVVTPNEQQTEQSQTETTSKPIKSDEQIAQSKMTVTDEGTEYTNFTYHFSVILPKSWGKIVESKDAIPNGVKIYDNISLVSENDSMQRYIQFQIVETKDKNDSLISDYPQTLITGNPTYTFYYSGSQDLSGYGGIEESVDSAKIQTEILQIKESFKLF